MELSVIRANMDIWSVPDQWLAVILPVFSHKWPGMDCLD